MCILDDDGGEDPSIEVSNSQPSQVIYEKESKIKIDYALLEEGTHNCPRENIMVEFTTLVFIRFIFCGQN